MRRAPAVATIAVASALLFTADRAVVLLDAQQTPAAAAPGQRQPGTYPLGPDSLPQEGVPKGKLEGPLLFKSQILAGTVRRYWVYVPSQYTGARRQTFWCSRMASARRIRPGRCVCRRLSKTSSPQDIPVTIGIFITPGQRGDAYPDDLGTGNPNNRAAEYDSLSDAYARFIVEEMLPGSARPTS